MTHKDVDRLVYDSCWLRTHRNYDWGRYEALVWEQVARRVRAGVPAIKHFRRHV